MLLFRFNFQVHAQPAKLNFCFAPFRFTIGTEQTGGGDAVTAKQTIPTDIPNI